MGGSSPEAPTTPDAIRASDEERDEAVSELGERFVEGRLSQETFMRRMDQALGARDRRQLDGLFADLPRRRPGAGALSSLRAAISNRARRGRELLAAEKEALSGAARESFRPRPGPRPGPRGTAAPPGALYFPPAPGLDARYTIGRDSGCDLLIEDLSVSRWHARLERAADRWILTDLNSTNGTRLNGWRVRNAVLVQAGDRLTFGSAVFVLCADHRESDGRESGQRESGPAAPAGPDHAGPGSG
jgi:Inner membrane component of T3SS, cytoplasmic domain/Domain of unknown function (DUF1707)